MIWLLLIFLPMALAGLASLSGRLPVLPGWLMAVAALPALAVSIGAFPVEETHFPGFLLGATFGLDATRSVLLLLAALLWGIAGAFAGSYLAGDAKRTSFTFFALLCMSGTFGLIVAADVPSFYTFFVLMTFAAYPLVIHTGTAEALRAGRVYLVMAIVGELFLLVALYSAVQAAGSLRVDALGSGVAAAENRNFILLFGLLGFGVKAGAVPLYFWLPLAHPVAPTPASAVLSGIMIKAGLLGWIHLSPLGAAESPAWSSVVIAMGLFAAFGAVFVGVLQTDPKTNLAYSSISQMGLMTALFGIGLAAGTRWETGAGVLALYALNHGLAKGALFLGTGVAAAAVKGRGWVLAGLILAAAAIAGAPFTGGALTKYGLKDAARRAPEPWEAILPWALPLSALATSLLLGRFLWLAWRKMGRGAHGSLSGLAAPWAVLLLAVAVTPFWANAHFQLESPAPEHSPGAWFEAGWPILLAAVILVAAARRMRGEPPKPAIPPGDLVVPLERFLAFCAATGRRIGLPDPKRGAINLVALSDRLLALERAAAIVQRTEGYLTRWKTIGILFLLIVLGFILTAL